MEALIHNRLQQYLDYTNQQWLSSPNSHQLYLLDVLGLTASANRGDILIAIDDIDKPVMWKYRARLILGLQR